MVGARAEHLSYDANEGAATGALMGSPVAGTTKVDSVGFDVNYWRSKRFRATLNYIYNRFSGDAPFVTGLSAKSEQELMFRLAIAF